MSAGRTARSLDTRTIVLGTVLLAMTGVGGAGVAQVSLSRAERVATPVVQVCADGGPAATQLAQSGACRAAAEAVQVGPYGSGR